MSTVRTQPCTACPYRQDVDSGLWAADEYAKLPPYDAPTSDQPMATFQCHATPEFYCHGWAVCHSNRGHEFDLLALRFWPAEVPEAAVLLFKSGTEAAAHGMRDIEAPSPEAHDTMDRLLTRYPRLLASRPARVSDE